MAYKSYPTLDSAIALRILLMLTTPFKDWELTKLGVMNDKGDIIMPKSKRTKPELRPTALQLFVRNVKRLINKLPGGENNLKNIVTAMILIKENMDVENPNILVEEAQLPNVDDPKYINDKQSFTRVWLEYVKLKEDGECGGGGAVAGGGGGASIPANNVSSGAIAMYDKPMMKMFRRKKKIL